MIGALIGGFLTDGPAWRYAFYVKLPFGFVALAVPYFVFHIFGRERRRISRSTTRVSLSLVASIVPFLLALSWGDRRLSVGLTSDCEHGYGRSGPTQPDVGGLQAA